VDIDQSRWANASNLRRAETYFAVETGSFVSLYKELVGDSALIEAATLNLIEGGRSAFVAGSSASRTWTQWTGLASSGSFPTS
jgi:hypothetical protein